MKSRAKFYLSAAERKMPVSLTLEEKKDIIASLDNRTSSRSALALKYGVTTNAVSKIYSRQRLSILEATSHGRLSTRRLRKSRLDALGARLYDWHKRHAGKGVIGQTILLEKAREQAAQLNYPLEELRRINLGWIHRWKKSHGLCKSDHASLQQQQPNQQQACLQQQQQQHKKQLSLTAAIVPSSGHNEETKSELQIQTGYDSWTPSSGRLESPTPLRPQRRRKLNVALTLFQKYAIITALDNGSSSQVSML